MSPRTASEIQRLINIGMRLPTTVPLDEGEAVEGPDFVDPLLERLDYERKKELIMTCLSLCTPSERSVILDLMDGCPAETIAKQRHVDPSRVSHHKRSAFGKIRAAIRTKCPELLPSSN